MVVCCIDAVMCCATSHKLSSLPSPLPLSVPPYPPLLSPYSSFTPSLLLPSSSSTPLAPHLPYSFPLYPLPPSPSCTPLVPPSPISTPHPPHPATPLPCCDQLTD